MARFALAVLIALTLPAVSRAQAPRTEVVTLLIEVISRDPRPLRPCGYLGRQPRDGLAHVLAVDGAPFDGQVQLRWRLCGGGGGQVDPGMRLRVRIRRRVGDRGWLATRHDVLSSEVASFVTEAHEPGV